MALYLKNFAQCTITGTLKKTFSLQRISMLIDTLHEQLKHLEPDISVIKAFWKNAQFDERIAALELKGQDITVWQDPKQAHILKELQALKNKREIYQKITTNYQEMIDLVDLFKDDESELEKLIDEIRQLARSIRSLKIQLLLHDEQDTSNCFISVNAGAGGTESQDWAEMLLRMYCRFCEQHGLDFTIVDYQPAEAAGIKGATLFVKGKNPYGLLKSEHGIHRLVRISPYDANKRRHTSFAGVHVIPENPKVEITIDPEDLRIDTYRSGGAGGQHVNKTESAIRITHLPTNIVVQCQNERSQGQNKDIAMKMLKAKLAQKQEEEALAKTASFEKKKIEWGSQIRSYVLHPYKMVKDHRTEFESQQPDLVLDGDLMGFIESYLLQNV